MTQVWLRLSLGIYAVRPLFYALVMYRKISAFTQISLSLVVSGCSSNAREETTPLPSSTSSPAPATEDPELVRNARGNLTRSVGESFTFRTADSKVAATVRIDDIMANPKCNSEFSEKPKDGELVALTFTVTTETELAELGDVGFDGGWWKFITKKGITYNGDLDTIAAYSCLDDKDRITSVGPSEKAQGSVVLEVPDTEGVLIYGIGDGIEFDLSKELKSK